MNLALRSEKQNFSKEIITGIKLSVELTTPVDDPRPVYIVGNFNNWRLDEERFRMKRIAHGRFSFHFPIDVTLPEVLEYKYVRGGWENQELDEYGNMTQNRVLQTPYSIMRVGSIINSSALLVPVWSIATTIISPLPISDKTASFLSMPQLP